MKVKAYPTYLPDLIEEMIVKCYNTHIKAGCEIFLQHKGRIEWKNKSSRELKNV